VNRFAIACVLGLAISLLACSKKPDDPLVAKATAAREQARVPAIAYAWFTRDGQDVGLVGEPKPSTFLAASIAKTIIGTCAMQLAVEKKLSLDADVSQYVGFSVRHPHHPTITVTLRLLLSHVASLVDDFDTLQAPGELEPFLRAYLSLPSHWAKAAPGAKLRYSNVGSAVAALAVERVAQRSFAEESNARVFEPLRMKSTEWDRRRAVYPVVDLRSSAADLARFGRAMLRGGELDGTRILPESAVEEMVRDSLGWQHTKIGAYALTGHEGEDKRASTGFYIERAKGIGALALANGDAFSSGDKRRTAAIADLLDALLATAVRSRDAD
jgi:CubicO group peptidase (beta-lactamase class C family)